MNTNCTMISLKVVNSTGKMMSSSIGVFYQLYQKNFFNNGARYSHIFLIESKTKIKIYCDSNISRIRKLISKLYHLFNNYKLFYRLIINKLWN